MNTTIIKLDKENYTAAEVLELIRSSNSQNVELKTLIPPKEIVASVIQKFGNRIFETKQLESFRARMLITVFMKKHTMCTHEQIGMIIGKNHSSVSYYIKKFDSEMTDKKFAETYRELDDILQTKL